MMSGDGRKIQGSQRPVMTRKTKDHDVYNSLRGYTDRPSLPFKQNQRAKECWEHAYVELDAASPPARRLEVMSNRSESEALSRKTSTGKVEGDAEIWRIRIQAGIKLWMTDRARRRGTAREQMGEGEGEAVESGKGVSDRARDNECSRCRKNSTR